MDVSRLGLADRGESSTQLDVPLFDLSGEGACADWNTVRGPWHLTGDADRGYDGFCARLRSVFRRSNRTRRDGGDGGTRTHKCQAF